MLNNPKINQRHLIIFTRYPEPGNTKTRLINTLGPEGAADLQRQMTEYTLAWAKKLVNTSYTSIEVRFNGGNLELMKAWLGDKLIYESQGEGDLGNNMGRSLFNAFQNNAQQVLLIGIDCPGLNADILTQAFDQLVNYDLIIGPAVDGGYYLLGLKRYIPELFINISWGTARVLQQTISTAQRLGLSQMQLQTLTDIDRPEDLLVWQSYSKVWNTH
ncbi:Glycosyltransferase [Richelia intracellularis HH01]|uniref:Glycosyltransferase n=1 Tax=Richelia intracellularis HH01 TaxID=1165094 RepID=M1WZ61_9NOST|nr:TIGR04282 family arsenosugar biosynthesis glycosyltransferase [Richelia intracellularis]CCH67302.1 Glycosyltransferase [Richelia intracellularis HH01]